MSVTQGSDCFDRWLSTLTGSDLFEVETFHSFRVPRKIKGERNKKMSEIALSVTSSLIADGPRRVMP